MLHSSDPGSTRILADVEAGITLALHAGGAQPHGHPGEEVPYDPKAHSVDQPLADGSPVVITAPGVRLRESRFGDVVLVKALARRKEAGR